jgi:hypothetical protein
MLAETPAFLIAIEQSAFAAAVRQSLWAYPAANVGHILALFLFAGAVSIMDLTLLGALRGAKPATIVLQSRNAAIGGLLLMMATGSILFVAEASHVAMNPVFQIKAALIGFGILNALTTGPPLRRALVEMPAGAPFPLRLRAAAVISLLTWLSVAACGRLIAYF